MSKKPFPNPEVAVAAVLQFQAQALRDRAALLQAVKASQDLLLRLPAIVSPDPEVQARVADALVPEIDRWGALLGFLLEPQTLPASPTN